MFFSLVFYRHYELFKNIHTSNKSFTVSTASCDLHSKLSCSLHNKFQCTLLHFPTVLTLNWGTPLQWFLMVSNLEEVSIWIMWCWVPNIPVFISSLTPQITRFAALETGPSFIFLLIFSSSSSLTHSLSTVHCSHLYAFFYINIGLLLSLRFLYWLDSAAAARQVCAEI